MIEQATEEAERKIRNLGLTYWADKLLHIRQSSGTEQNKAAEVLKLFGSFGTLNDIAFSDSDAPMGLTGDEATKIYFACINTLHRVATSVAAQHGA